MIHDIYLFYGYNNGYDIYYLKIYFEMKYIEDNKQWKKDRNK